MILLPKSDLNSLYYQDIITYQKENCQYYATNHSERRELSVNKVYQYFEQVIQMILSMKPNAYREFYDVSTSFIHWISNISILQNPYPRTQKYEHLPQKLTKITFITMWYHRVNTMTSNTNSKCNRT